MASMGLVLLRTLTAVGENATTPPVAAPVVTSAVPAPVPTPPAANSAEAVPAFEPTESNDPGSTCTMTVPSALEETWLPTWLPSATREAVPASE